MEGAGRAQGFTREVVGSFLKTSCAGCGSDSPSKKAWSRSVLVDAANVRRLGTDGRWQHETPYKEELQLVRHSTDLRFEGAQMRQAYNAGEVKRLGKLLGSIAE